MDALSLNSTSLQEAVFFLLPGFFTIFLFFYRIPDRKKSDLTVIILAVVVSVLLTSVTNYIFNGINFVTNLKANLNEMSPAFNWVRIFLGLVIAHFLSQFVHSDLFVWINKNILNISYFPFGRLWNSFFRIPNGTYVKVFMNNGSCYVGLVHATSVDPEDDIQEIELWKPYYFDKEKGSLKPIIETESVLLLGNSIASIEKVTKKEARFFRVR